MFESRRILIKLLFVGVSSVLFTGCGQTGPLYLPVKAEPAKEKVTVGKKFDAATKQAIDAQ